ncbi:class I SAM-dependent methyltransferase [Adhaeribacter radiodurans]|uniref:Class I SAM-dependent methyltransferase n=1 Tax=Adhaeribacter radiodurans TaxID=2745197 RepID=A0A7L7LC86_9BACT|nr:class I SAM-dependent methyltransferase [Adhaeribacter radiodurans]QMU30456.1 class I SAM-dependent methyltransferase [Adhaeribacter radiodurans]
MRASFDRVSWFYDPLAKLIFGGAIQKSQVVLLPFIPAQTSVLILGGGTGWLLRDLARLQLPLKITYLEISPRMLTKAKKTLAGISNHFLQVDFRQGNEASLAKSEMFDVIFTPFVLDLYPEHLAAAMVEHLQQHLKLNGKWLVADFYLNFNQAHWQKWWQQSLLKAMYAFFSKLCQLETSTLPNFDQLFQNTPLTLVKTEYFFQGFIRSQVYHHILKPL